MNNVRRSLAGGITGSQRNLGGKGMNFAHTRYLQKLGSLLNWSAAASSTRVGVGNQMSEHASYRNSNPTSVVEGTRDVARTTARSHASDKGKSLPEERDQSMLPVH